MNAEMVPACGGMKDVYDSSNTFVKSTQVIGIICSCQQL